MKQLSSSQFIPFQEPGIVKSIIKKSGGEGE